MKKKSLLFYCLSAVCLSFLLPGPVLAVENDACMECHADELERDASTGHSAIMIVDLEKFTASPHGENACVDCHNDIEELNWDNDVPHGTDLVDPACADCHDETTSAYAESVHVEAEISCNDCHSYHAPVPVAGKQDVVMMQADFCGKCHDAAASHDWLAQKEVHFQSIQCTVCHAPEDSSHLRLRVVNSREHRYLSGAEIIDALNIEGDFAKNFDVDGDGIISAGDGILDGGEFRALAQAIVSARHLSAEITAELTSAAGPMAHKITSEAIGDCEVCHAGDSAMLANAKFELTGDHGNMTMVPVESKAASSFYIRDFYVLGGTRICLLDLIGLLLFVGGVSVVILHAGVKVLTKPIREKRAAEKSHSNEEV